MAATAAPAGSSHIEGTVLPRSCFYILVACVLLTAGCASTSERDAYGSLTADTARGPYLLRSRAELEARVVGPVALNLDSALPVVQSREASLLAGGLALGEADGPLSYSASYALSPGDIVHAGQSPFAAPPSGLGEQRINQQAMLKLPELAGAPLALGYSRSSADRWTTDDAYEQHRQVASLRWAPEFAEFDLRWAGPGSGFSDPDLALDCDITGDLQLPLAAVDPSGSSYLQLSGRGCDVTGSGARFSDLDAQTYGLAYGWQRSGRESRLELAAIDPVWGGGQTRQHADPSYELGLTQTLRREAWSTSFKAARRQLASSAGGDAPEARGQWMTSAKLTRELSDFSVSASWAHGHDPQWFAPAPGAPSDRLGLAMNFSRWAQTVAPHWNPNLSLSWRWERDRAAEAAARNEQALRLDLSAYW